MQRLTVRRLVLSVMLLAAVCAAGTARAAEIILYDGLDFEGQRMTLTQSSPSLDTFAYRTESVKVISGTWKLYRNFNYGVSAGPSVTLTPGEYRNLGDVGFPVNRLASVRLFVERPTTRPGATQTCTGPYRTYFSQNGRLVCKWTCGRNSHPDEARNRCSCDSGYVGRGTDRSGRVRCLARSGTVVPSRQTRYIVNGAIALGVANRNGFRTDTEAYFAKCLVAGHMVNTRKKGIIPRVPECRVRFFARRSLAPGWRMVDAQVRFARPRAADAAVEDGHCGRSVCQLSGRQQMPPIRLRALESVQLISITLVGPAGRNWREAFARR